MGRLGCEPKRRSASDKGGGFIRSAARLPLSLPLMAAAIGAAAPSSMASRAAMPRGSGVPGGRRSREGLLRLAMADGYPSSTPASSLPLRLSRPPRFSSLVACARRGKKSSPAGQNGAPRKAKVRRISIRLPPLPPHPPRCV